MSLFTVERWANVYQRWEGVEAEDEDAAYEAAMKRRPDDSDWDTQNIEATQEEEDDEDDPQHLE